MGAGAGGKDSRLDLFDCWVEVNIVDPLCVFNGTFGAASIEFVFGSLRNNELKVDFFVQYVGIDGRLKMRFDNCRGESIVNSLIGSFKVVHFVIHIDKVDAGNNFLYVLTIYLPFKFFFNMLRLQLIRLNKLSE